MDRTRGPILAGLLGLLAFFWGYNRDNFESAWANFRSDEGGKKKDTLAVESSETPEEVGTDTENGNTASRNDIPAAVPGATISRSPFSPPIGPPGEVGQTAERRANRNLYFERLSEQLKEMQGEAPPPTAAQPPSSPPSEVTSEPLIPPPPIPMAVPQPSGFPPGYPPIEAPEFEVGSDEVPIDMEADPDFEPETEDFEEFVDTEVDEAEYFDEED